MKQTIFESVKFINLDEELVGECINDIVICYLKKIL